MGRGSETSCQQAHGVLTNRTDHIYATPNISYWERVGNSLRMAKAHAVNYSFDALEGVLRILDKQINDLDVFWPPEVLHSYEHFKHLISKAIHPKDAGSWKHVFTWLMPCCKNPLNFMGIILLNFILSIASRSVQVVPVGLTSY